MATQKPDIFLVKKPNVKSIFFISDLHILDENSEVFKKLIGFIEKNKTPEVLFVLGGDIFHVLVGSSNFFKLKFQNLFKSLNGSSWIYLTGNHDFHFEKIIEKFGGLYSEKKIILEADSKKFYFAHGDEVDEGDKAYLRLRNFFHSKASKFLIDLVPGIVLFEMGKVFGAISRDSRKKRKLGSISSEDQNKSAELFKKFALKIHDDYHVNAVFLGHNHIPFCGFLEGKIYYLNPGGPESSVENYKVAQYVNGEFQLIPLI